MKYPWHAFSSLHKIDFTPLAIAPTSEFDEFSLFWELVSDIIKLDYKP